MYLSDTDRIEAIQNPKELDLADLSWVGAAIVAPTTSTLHVYVPNHVAK